VDEEGLAAMQQVCVVGYQGAKVPETDVQVEVLLIYRGWLSAVGFGRARAELECPLT
jgi:hypothetical protein